MKLIAIAAVDENWSIGNKNELIYNIPEDMRFFRDTTKNNVIVYGKNTLYTFKNKKPLPHRINIILSSSLIVDEDEDTFQAHNLEELFNILKENDFSDKTIYICGGGKVYSELINYCEEAYITKIHENSEDSDTSFPNLNNMDNWELVEEGHPILTETQYKISFQKYKNKTPVEIK